MMQVSSAVLAQELDERLADPAELACRLEAFQRCITRRLVQFRRRVNLVTYEGSVLDRLALHFVHRGWRREDYSLVCSVRPCMLPALIREVEAFAADRRLPLVSFDADCPARHPWEADAARTCENIGKHIYRTLRGSDGLLVSSALMNADTKSGFTVINQEYSGLYVMESPELARYRVAESGRTWRTLFLFEGFRPADIVLAYLYFVSDELEAHHMPVCYLDCYNERQQRALIELVKSRKAAALAYLRAPAREQAPRASSVALDAQ